MLGRVCASAFLLAALGSLTALAGEQQPLPGAYMALGQGARVSCGAFVREMTKGTSADVTLGVTVLSWIEGYLSANNQFLANSPDVAGNLTTGLGPTDVMGWVIDWCGAHSDAVIADAAHAVKTHLFETASARAQAP